jgi:hypothetical protein
MPPRDLTPEDVADWLTPPQAVALVDAAHKDVYLTKNAILERLRAGMVQAVARHSAVGTSGARQLFFKIPSDHWERIQSADPFWRLGDITYQHREYGSTAVVTVRHFDVRFEPQGIRAMIPSASKNTVSPTAAIQDETSNEPAQKGPRVSDAHLQAWFEFYKKVHSGAEDTEDRALEFARQCFSGKLVSRDRVRALRGSVKRGPKTKLT